MTEVQSVRRTVTRRFRGHDFTISVSVNAEILAIDVRQLGGPQWTGKFTSRFIEEITQRTGSFKVFGVFVKMLVSALNSDSDSLSLDLMASEDLHGVRSASLPSVVQSDKRYLILTYSSEFDKVHYPLALSLSVSGQTAAGCVCGLAQTNAELQRQMADLLARETRSRLEFERLVHDFEDERNRLTVERRDSLSSAERAELAALRESNGWFESEIYSLKEARTKLVAKHKTELDNLQHEVASLKHNERQLKLKLKQTEQDLVLASKPNKSVRPPPPPPPPRPYSRTPSPRSRTGIPQQSSVSSPRRGPVPWTNSNNNSPAPKPRPVSASRRPDTARSTLSEYAEQSSMLSMRSPSRPAQTMRPPSRAAPGDYGPSPRAAAAAAVDIKDIDARLTALQNFLKQSKLNAGL